ncbi:MAG: hypothetical protein Q9201_003323 [Fulgogasparrea decipioides]
MKLSEVPKVKVEDASCVVSTRRRIHGHRAEAEIKAQRRQKKHSTRRKLGDDEGEVDNEDPFEGLRPAELLSPKYLKYRAKQRQKFKDSGDEGKWPDYLEHAFQLALRAVPPVGRKKKVIDGKLCGRNEELSKKIKLWTGVERDRKQISSHIQVLRGFMNDNPEWMQHVTVTPKDEEASHAVSQHLQIASLRDDQIDSYARCRYGEIGQMACSSTLSIPPPGGILGSNVPPSGPLLNRIELEMFVLSPTNEQIHKYTSTQTNIGAPSRALEEVHNWHTSFPRLASYYDQGQLNSDIILIESNLDLLAELPPKGSSLYIGCIINIVGASSRDRWSYKTDYYTDNGQPVDMRPFYAMNKKPRTTDWDEPNVFRSSGNSDIQLEIFLQSNWWAHLFANMAGRKQDACCDPELLQQEEQWTRRYLEEMSIMQEVWVSSGTDSVRHDRVAIILWQFSQTRVGQAGTTTWRKLFLPPDRSKVNSPIQSPTPPLQQAMVLDTTLRTLAMPQPLSVNAERFLQQSNLFADDSEQIVSGTQSAQDSPSPALSPDYSNSFPSSTTTSFPPSVTHGYLSHEESQESACFSQESDSHRQGRLASQHSYIFSQESTYIYKKQDTFDEDLLRIPEPALQESAYYSQQCFGSIPQLQCPMQYNTYDDESSHSGLAGTHDFAGGHIQLSFQQHGAISDPHPPPYNSPSLTAADIEHRLQEASGIGEHELHPATHDFSSFEPETMIASHPSHTDFDFSTLESHFTAEELAAIRSNNINLNENEGLLHSNFGETQQSEEQGIQTQTQISTDERTVTRTVECFGSTLVERTQGQLKDTDVAQTAHGVVLGEVTEGEANGADEGFGFEGIPYDDGVESQVTDGHGQQIGNGIQPDLEDIDNLEEDHL